MTDKITFTASDETGKMIRDLADSEFKGHLAKTMNHIINKAFNRFQILADGCPARTYIDDHYECTWGRIGRSPDTKKIGISDEAMNNRCIACKKTIDIRQELFTLKETVAKGIIANIPSCVLGGRLSEDGKKLYCNRSGEYKNVEKKCKVLRNGANCKDLRWSRILIKGKLPDGQNL